MNYEYLFRSRNYELRIMNTNTKDKKIINNENRSSFFGRIFLIPNLPVRQAGSKFFIQNKNGFSLVELMVTITIFTVISSIVLVNQSDFNSSIKLTNLAYEVALKIREAQSYGISVRGFEGSFIYPYGVHFDKGSPDSFVFFADKNYGTRPGYNASSDGLVDILSIKGEISIKKFCATQNAGGDVCSDAGSISRLDVLFIRPNPGAFILVDGANGYKSAKITIQSNRGAGGERHIHVESSGQIYVER